MFDYKTPFHMEGQRIFDRDGNEVRLWGVNYYAPFHHNYIHMKDKGVSHRKAIDRDIEDFRRMGVQLIRMHLFDRELSDMEGNLVENEHLELLDYLIEKCHQSGIYMMITTMAWWTSTETQNELRKGYAHMTFGDLPAFGFANFCPKHMLMWHPKFMDLQERYIRQLFAHKNRFSGKSMPEYDHIALVEIINEPEYPRSRTIENLRCDREQVQKNCIRREELLLVDAYDAHVAETGCEDTYDEREAFCASLVGKYIDRMFSIVDEVFGSRVLKTHIFYEFDNPPFREMLKKADRLDLLSLAFYSDLACYYTPNHRIIPDQVLQPGSPHGYDRYIKGDIRGIGKGLISYEWAMTCTLTGFDHVAVARAIAALGVQCAAYFTYTPRDVADYNPGWVMQYMNLYHTPRRAAGFAAAGGVFRTTPYDAPVPTDNLVWEGENFRLSAANDVSFCREGDTLWIAGENACELPEALPGKILVQGAQPWLQRTGNGAVILERQGENEWKMTVLPDQFYVNDPYQGRNYRGKAFLNRDDDVNAVPVVSRLREAGSRTCVQLPGFENARLEFRADGEWIPVDQENGAFVADPGIYRIVKESV